MKMHVDVSKNLVETIALVGSWTLAGAARQEPAPPAQPPTTPPTQPRLRLRKDAEGLRKVPLSSRPRSSPIGA